MVGKRVARAEPKQRFHLAEKVIWADALGFGGKAHKTYLVQARV